MAAPSGGGGGGGGRRARAKPVRFRVSEKTQERAEQTKAALERMYEEKAKVRDEIAERCVALMCPSPIHNTGALLCMLVGTCLMSTSELQARGIGGSNGGRVADASAEEGAVDTAQARPAGSVADTAQAHVTVRL